MHFGENQLSPRSFGISPLPTAHPSILNHRWVRASSPFYRTFTLAMGSSPGFGSTACDLPPCSDSLSLRLRPCGLNLATPSNSPAHSSISTPSLDPVARSSSYCSGARGFRFLAPPFRGTFHLSLTVL